MKKGMRQLNILLTSAVLCFGFSVPVFAEETVKYSNELTSSPIRIFFAILIIPAFIAMEIVFEKFREKRIEKRNKSYEKEENE